MPRTLALRHVAFEDLGLLEPLLRRRGHTVEYLDVPVAAMSDVDPLAPDLLVVLGGPIGVYENHLYPFLDAELALLAGRLAAHRPTLGICLGSQLMAKALGARVYPSGVKEIGWAPLTLTEEGARSPLKHLASTEVLHWHGDTFDLPDGATRLASTAACKNQAFSFAGGAALALQFHGEAFGTALEAWFVGHTAEIAATPGISVPQLRADTARCSDALRRQGTACFEDWLSAVQL
jgi:GMP synthase (glutamine-hydrolysing)